MASDVSRLSAAEVSLSADLIAQRGFGTARRGFDPDEVRTFLNQVAREFRAVRQREAALEQSLREAEYRAAHPSWDENTLMSAVGEETASILRSAHAAAADIRARAEENAARILKEGHDQAEAMRGDAQTVLSARTEEAEAAASRIREAAAADAERIRDGALQQAEAIRQQTDAERRAIVEAAQSTRERILGDLARRRRVAVVQIEQLRAGRERLLESYRVVRRTLEEVTDELQRADAEARAAAEAVGRRQASAQEHAAPPVDEARSTDSGAGSEPGPAAATGEAASVRDLFARIRADQQEASTQTEPASAETPPAGESLVTGQAPGTGEPSPTGEVPPAGDAATTGDALATRDASPNREGDPPASDAGSERAQAKVPNADETMLQRRDEAIGTIEANLAKRLKRVLQDEQNDLLDRLRNVKDKQAADAILIGRDVQTARFADAGRPALEQAARVGSTFVTSLEGRDSAGGEVAGLDVLTDGMASAVVDPLRRRLEEVLGEGSESDPTALAESIGGAYREWKTHRIEQAATDHVAGAFAAGAFSATSDGARLRWVVDDVDGPCPDCDDNALAGALPKGEAYPTGQAHPPAHPGCRCLLVPAPD
jgi:DivIVA domain-containing protein